MDPTADRAQRFAAFLEDLAQRQDRAALAALRRGLGKPPGEAAEMHRYVVPWLPRDGPRWEEDIYYEVAALFALHPMSWTGGDDRRARNFGASFARLAQAVGSESIEGRFVALLNAHQDDLPAHLRHAVGLLASHDIPVDWAQLLRHLRDWGRESRYVQRDWARAYWGAGAGQAPERTNLDADGPGGQAEPAAEEA